MASDLKKSIEGILTHYKDKDGRVKRLIEELSEKKESCICLSWDKIYPKKGGEVEELMRNKIKDDHRFDFYFFRYKQMWAKAVVEDIACDEDEYASKAFVGDDSWEKKGAGNLKEKFSDFSSEGKDVKIVFFISEFTDDLNGLPSYLLEPGGIKYFNHWNDDGENMHSYIIPYERLYSENEVDNLKTINTMNEKLEGPVRECKRLLEENKNLVLTGAPGTGKTYMAKQVAKALTGIKTDDELEMSEQFGFVQFHPSYDYTDFVEGLRPTKPDDNGNIGFELKPGVFKTFCERARKNLEDSLKSVEEISMEKQLAEKYGKLVELIQNEEPIELTYKTGKPANIFDVSDNNNIRFKRGDGSPSSNVVSLERLQRIAEKYRSKADLANLTTNEINQIVGGCNPSRFWAVLNYLYTEYGDLTVDSVKELQVEKKNYVFVIDEINRGEISKIFGELFFSIDPGYRGKRGAVDTQYANMHKEEGKFYVPENVYILGTMNDIDRSVESFDFAMRRRFTWKEITAEDSAKSMALSPETIKRMAALNKKIADVEGLGQAYQIGGAYFLGIDETESENGDDGKHLNYGKVWELKLEPLLKEYLRGMPDAKNTLKSMKDAYDLKKEEQVQQGTETTQVNADEPTTQSSNN